jgi:hypothetical protein
MPSRNLAVAIREYAPGAQLVIDGRVFRSAGISLNWQKLGSSAKEAQKFDVAWQCSYCGQTGIDRSSSTSDELKCSSCNRNIPSSLIKKTIEPTGFVTDFFDSPGNDITRQNYIPVQPGWLSLNGEDFPLPNPATGFMSYGNNATLFQHSSGEYGTGFAVCLSCGKAESMTINSEFPVGLSPTSEHRPITSTPKSKDSDGYQPPCDGSATVHSDIHIGCTSLTDAFELTLKHPITGQYIDVSDEGETVALTLAVSLRNALAHKLGISTSEIGYSVRPSRDLNSNLPAMVIQLYDAISGGAGFATSSARFIGKLLVDMHSNLACSSSCEEACSSCLLDSNTRHDANHLDRKAAIEWLGNDFKKFISLPSEYEYLTGSKYCHESIKECVSHQINKGANSIKVWLSKETNEWDLDARQVHMFIYQMIQINGVELSFVLPNIQFGENEKRSLLRYKELGIKLLKPNKELTNGNMVALVESANKSVSIASQSAEMLSPNGLWLESNSEDMLVKSTLSQDFKFSEIDTSQWIVNLSDGARVEFSTEVNGEIKSFGDRFWSFICGEYEPLANEFKNSELIEVAYTDRYLQSPWYMIMLGEIIRGLPFNSKTSFELHTLFSTKPGAGRFINHDWAISSDMVEVLSLWFQEGIKLPCFIDLHENRADISHRRELTLKFKNGNEYCIGFDQGVGYWNHDLPRNKHYFDFEDVSKQLVQMCEAWENGSIKNGFDWKTVIYINKS